MDIFVEGFQIRQHSAQICKYIFGVLLALLAHNSHLFLWRSRYDFPRARYRPSASAPNGKPHCSRLELRET